MNRYKLVPANKGFWGRFAARMMFQRDDLRRENKRLREALEFYANKQNLQSKRAHTIGYYSMDIDGGYTARKALEGEQHGPSTD